MNENSLARRYTRALVETLPTEEEFRTVQSHLLAFQELLESDPMLRTGLQTFLLGTEKKREALEFIGQRLGLSPRTAKFLEILMEGNRLSLLRWITPQMEELWHEAKGKERFTVYSVLPLSPEQLKALERNLAAATGKEVVIRQALDKGILGGIKIQRGSIWYDFSLQGNLERLKTQIVEER